MQVTVYRLICKETVEEKILQRASQKNTVQQLVMTGGHVQDDLLAPEDVVSLLIDDAQLAQKLKEIPLQVGAILVISLFSCFQDSFFIYSALSSSNFAHKNIHNDWRSFCGVFSY